MTPQFLSITFWAPIVGILAIAGFNSWTSRLNQFFFFSRTVPDGFSQTPPARRIISVYLRGVGLACVSALFIFFGLYASGRMHAYRCFLLAIVVQCACSCAAFARAHRDTGNALQDRAAELPSSEASAPSTVVSVPLLDPGAFTSRHMLSLFLAPAVAVLVSAVALFASHLNVHQFIDAIEANKASFLSGMGLGMVGASLMLYIQLRYFSRHRSPMGRFTANGCVQLAWIGALAFTLSTLSVPLHLVLTRQVKTILVGAILAFAILRMLYGWSRARLFPPPQVERSGDQFWRWGLFYYNPSDPTLFIQHRSGPGYTVNFANFMAWPLALLLLADLAFLFFLHH